MAATARQIPVTGDDLEGGGGGAFAEIPAPSDQEARLVSVEDYDKTNKGKSRGWKFGYSIETPSGGSVTFDVYLSFSPNARWKLIKVLEAHDVPLEEGLIDVDPNSLVGDMIGTTVDFPRDEDDNPTSNYREIRDFFPLVVAADVPVIEKVAEAVEGALEHDEERDGAMFGDEPDII